MIQKLKIITWNANRLTERKHELEVFLTTNKIDVALISKTRFTSRSYLNINNYTVHTTNYPSGNSHGGTAVIIKTNISHHSLEEYCTEQIQATSVVIKDSTKNNSTTLTAIYCPPRHAITSQQFDNLFDKQNSSKFICGGDWNAKHTYWGSRLISPRGRQLLKSVNKLNLECISTGEPTHWPGETLSDLSSDHSPVMLNINY